MAVVTEELRERRLKAWESMKSILTESRDEGMSGEQQDAYAKLEEEELRLRNDIEARERAAKLEAALAKPRDVDERVTRMGGDGASGFQTEERVYKRAFDSWLRGNEVSMEERKVLQKGRFETRDLSVGSGASGGYLVPEQFSNRIFEHRRYFGGVRDVAGQITTTSGGDLMWPSNDDTGSAGAWLAEGGTVTEQDTTFRARTFKAFKATSKMVQVTWELMQDSAFDLEAFLSRKFGERIGRLENLAFTVGTGATQPEGFVTNGVTVATATSDTTVLKDIVSLIYGVDRAYRINGKLMMNDLIVAHLRKEQASTGEFVWQPSAQAGEPDRLFGYPLVINNDMAGTPTTDAAKVAAFGDFENGYMIRDVRGIAVIRLNERYAENMLTAFFAVARVDGQPVYDTATPTTYPPFKILQVA